MKNILILIIIGLVFGTVVYLFHPVPTDVQTFDQIQIEPVDGKCVYGADIIREYCMEAGFDDVVLPSSNLRGIGSCSIKTNIATVPCVKNETVPYYTTIK